MGGGEKIWTRPEGAVKNVGSVAIFSGVFMGFGVLFHFQVRRGGCKNF